MEEFLTSLLANENLHEFVGGAAKSNISQWLFVVAVVWATMGRKVATRFGDLHREMKNGLEQGLDDFRSHFGRIEVGINNVASEVKDLKTTVAKDLNIHAQRLGNLENGIVKLTSRVESLEKQKG